MTDAIKLAIEALEAACGNRCNAEYNPCQAREAIAALRAQPDTTVPDNMQDWKGMDGAIAWHLMERHADNWSDVGKMMGEWLEANRAQPDHSELVKDAARYRWLKDSSGREWDEEYFPAFMIGWLDTAIDKNMETESAAAIGEAMG